MQDLNDRVTIGTLYHIPMMEVMDSEIGSTSPMSSTPRTVHVYAHFPPYNHNMTFFSSKCQSSHTPEIRTPPSKHNNHHTHKTNHRNSFVLLLHLALESLLAILQESTSCKSLFATPLQATEIRAEEGKSEDDEGDGEGSTAEKGVDAGYTGVRVAVCVLEDAGEDADNTGHAVFLLALLFFKDWLRLTHC
ncbi:hypothetical protein E4T42_07387 [Aureobasidium subglaciale]|nr:hypothetical protein E4T42_07387 [Aureobasidium subglaciale]